MSVSYDKYYQTKNLFGGAYPELMEFLAEYPQKGKVLDLGCGQGRDAIPLARMGFDVTGMDNSKVGIDQMNQIANAEELNIDGIVGDIFEFDNYAEYDFVLLDSMFHFTKRDKKKEVGLIKKTVSKVKKGCLIIFCIQDTDDKVDILNNSVNFENPLNRIKDQKFEYTFEDSQNGRISKTPYKMIVVQK